MEDKTGGVDTLTPRQKEILRLIAQNLQAKEIARLLDISERTVKTHTDAARRRLGVATSREAARLLIAWEAEHDIVPAIVPEGHRPPGTMDAGTDTPSSSPREHLSGGKAAGAPPRGDLQAWLDGLNPLQWLGLIAAVAVICAMLLTGLVAAVLSTMEVLQRFFRAAM